MNQDRGPIRSRVAALCGLWFGVACTASAASPTLLVERLAGEVRVDGQLDEPCYQSPPAVTNFSVAGAPDSRPQPTRAWLFWHPDRLVVAFEVSDTEIVAAPPSGREHDVDAQDRVELFLWSGQGEDTYFCIEVGARGAVHDYAARFYRQFDDSWTPAGLKVGVASLPLGYAVEAELPRSALESAGFKLRAGAKLRAGLFRADFRPNQPDDPTWICWVDAREPKPDFHVANSFGQILFVDRSAVANTSCLGTADRRLPRARVAGLDAARRFGSQTRATLAHHAQKYLRVGGFPEVQTMDEDLRRRVLQNYLDVVILRDVVERHALRNTVVLRALIRHLLTAPATYLSVTKCYSTLRSQGIACTKNDLYLFLDALAADARRL